MGQYYIAVLLNPETKDIEAAFYPALGLKLMEHSWLMNTSVSRVMAELEGNPMRVVWAGDYADDELTRICIKIKESQAAFERGEIKEPLTLWDFRLEIEDIKGDYRPIEEIDTEAANRIVDGELRQKLALPLDKLVNTSSENAKNLYEAIRDNYVCETRPYDPRLRYIVNDTKKQYVDIKKSPKSESGWQTHPLPLLTCEGNGRGGGDYRLDNPNIGIWSRDVIYTTRTKPVGCVEIDPHFESDI